LVNPDPSRHGGRLGWSLRRYAWGVLACVLAGAGIPLVVAGGESYYQAESLVVAQSLAINDKALPSLAERVFANGAVAAEAAKDPGVEQPTDSLVPEQLSVVAAENSIVLTVQARHADPDTAARLADTGARTFVAELNKGGAGVGQFSVEEKAAVPTEPEQEISPLVWAAVGALAGLLLGLGIVALVAAIRRPVVTPDDVSSAVGVPLLGTVKLPVGRRTGYPGPLGVRGIATVARWLATAPPGRLLFVSPSTGVALRQRIYVMAAVALSTVRTVRHEADAPLLDAIERHRTDLRNAGRPVKESGAAPDALVLVDGGSALELVDPAVTHVSVVVVAARGTPRARLRALAADYADGGLVGVVMVDVRPDLRRARARRTGTSPAVPQPAGAAGRVSLPEPERA
jgi:hypothetical protein